MTTTQQALLAERRADLREDEPGSVAATVAHLLGSADEYLIDESQGAATMAVERASGEVGQAIAVLTQYRARLDALQEVMVAEAMAQA